MLKATMFMFDIFLFRAYNLPLFAKLFTIRATNMRQHVNRDGRLSTLRNVVAYAFGEGYQFKTPTPKPSQTITGKICHRDVEKLNLLVSLNYSSVRIPKNIAENMSDDDRTALREKVEDLNARRESVKISNKTEPDGTISTKIQGTDHTNYRILRSVLEMHAQLNL